jgi:lipopolysaccharide/colanic/teichoic acid biosynthesis glycosyltransferase
VKRVLDVVASVLGLIVGSVILAPAMIAVWLQDYHSPFYVASRVGRGGGTFRMVKLRSMRVLADTTGVASTASDDSRITTVGRLVRRWKLDELTQLWNVLKGDMSLVGPRPQVAQDVARYTDEERRLLTVRPGITDMASIVFADEGAILTGADDPDERYQQLIRPWKARLALLYVDTRPGLLADLRLLWLTLLNSVSRRRALEGVAALVRSLGGDPALERVAQRATALEPAPPPGGDRVFTKPPPDAAARSGPGAVGVVPDAPGIAPSTGRRWTGPSSSARP